MKEWLDWFRSNNPTDVELLEHTLHDVVLDGTFYHETGPKPIIGYLFAIVLRQVLRDISMPLPVDVTVFRQAREYRIPEPRMGITSVAMVAPKLRKWYPREQPQLPGGHGDSYRTAPVWVVSVAAGTHAVTALSGDDESELILLDAKYVESSKTKHTDDGREWTSITVDASGTKYLELSPSLWDAVMY
jgi:hypothetical protein